MDDPDAAEAWPEGEIIAQQYAALYGLPIATARQIVHDTRRTTGPAHQTPGQETAGHAGGTAGTVPAQEQEESPE